MRNSKERELAGGGEEGIGMRGVHPEGNSLGRFHFGDSSFEHDRPSPTFSATDVGHRFSAMRVGIQHHCEALGMGFSGRQVARSTLVVCA